MTARPLGIGVNARPYRSPAVVAGASVARWTATVAVCTLTLILGVGPSAASAFGSPGVAMRHVRVPGPPSDLVATVDKGQVILRWKAPPVTRTTGAPTDYLVLWEAPPLLPLAAEADTHSTATKYTSMFGAGTYEVEAKNAKGTGPSSAPVTICTPTASNPTCSTES